MDSQSEKYTDISFLTSMTGGNKEKISKYITMFLDSSPGLISQLDSQVEKEDWSGIKTTAHTLKSQFSYMGANQAKELALDIEMSSGEKANLEEIPVKAEKLKMIFIKACEELKTTITNL